MSEKLSFLLIQLQRSEKNFIETIDVLDSILIEMQTAFVQITELQPDLKEHFDSKKTVFRVMRKMMDETVIMLQNDTIKEFYELS